MTNAEPTDYAAKLEQIFSRDSREGNFYIFASQISMIQEAAALIRRQTKVIKELTEAAEEGLFQLTPHQPKMDGLDRTRMWLREAIKKGKAALGA